jgi:hypothetical protein
MDIAGVIAIAAGAAALARAARKKRPRKSSGSSRKGGGFFAPPTVSASWPDLLAGRGPGLDIGAALSRSRPGAPAGPSRTPAARSRSTAAGTRSTGTTALRRRPDRAQMEREGVPHPLIVKRRRSRRRELLREAMNVGMGSAAVGVSTAGLLFDAGSDPERSVVAGALAAAVFGWILGREVLSDLIHLGP